MEKLGFNDDIACISLCQLNSSWKGDERGKGEYSMIGDRGVEGSGLKDGRWRDARISTHRWVMEGQSKMARGTEGRLFPASSLQLNNDLIY